MNTISKTARRLLAMLAITTSLLAVSLPAAGAFTSYGDHSTTTYTNVDAVTKMRTKDSPPGGRATMNWGITQTVGGRIYDTRANSLCARVWARGSDTATGFGSWVHLGTACGNGTSAAIAPRSIRGYYLQFKVCNGYVQSCTTANLARTFIL